MAASSGLSEAPRVGVERALEVIAEREHDVHAFVHLDAAGARAAASHAGEGPLAGLTLGIKDIFDTADMPSEYGSPIYARHQPSADAAAVALLRSAGAIAIGKTVTTELAWFTPGPTTNPHRHTHTPGGSSSGSAAAVAAGMVDLALGTQTAGSVIRPASFCGVYGYKPTFGLVPTTGVKPAAPSLDTVGVFAGDLALLDAARAVLTRQPLADFARPTRLAFVRTDQWAHLDADGATVVERAAELAGADETELSQALDGLADAHVVVQCYEGALALSFERERFGELLSPGLSDLLERGVNTPRACYDDVRRRARLATSDAGIAALFADADVLVTAAAPGEAPAGLTSTGDPRFCRLWSLLGLPAICVPGLRGATGLPIGIQLVARPGEDAALFAAAHRLERVLVNA